LALFQFRQLRLLLGLLAAQLLQRLFVLFLLRCTRDIPSPPTFEKDAKNRLTCASKAASFFFFAAVLVGLLLDVFDADFAPDFGVLGVLFFDELDVVDFADFLGDLKNTLR
jgi:hypothetical protein